MFFAKSKLVITTLLCLTFFALFGFSVYAESEDFVVDEYSQVVTNDDVLEYFGYTDDYLIELVSVNEMNAFATPLFSSYDVELYRSDVLKDLGPLQLSSGFERDRLTTFSSSKAIAGIGEEGSVVGLHVFHIETETLISTQDTLFTIGKSGLYNETVAFDYVGVNYVLLTVEDSISFATTKRLFKVTLKEIETRNKLENMTINFFEEESESPSIEKFVPEIVNFGF